MADNHPYVSTPGGLVQVITHFRKSFPTKVSAETLRKLGYAPKNESYILNVLRHLELIDDQGNRTAAAQQAFSQHGDGAFSDAFEGIVKKAYSDLFELHGDDAWALDQDALITFFRSSDQTTALVGKRQASTFQVLAGFAGHGDLPEAKPRKRDPSKRRKPAEAPKAERAERKSPQRQKGSPATPNIVSGGSNVGLTVRIEINLPADGDQETYDRIFRSIRKNLLDG